MKRPIAIALAAVLGAGVLACASGEASGGPDCGSIESPCGIAGDTVPDGWSRGLVPTGDGRSVLCVMYWSGRGNSSTVAMSCDWEAR